MDQARWDRIEEICASALERTGITRQAYLEEACAGDDSLRQDVMALIEEAETGTGFLARPLVDAGTLTLPPGVTPEAPDRIGPWRLVRRIGRGGMGEVYLATREADGVEQRVALKVIRRGMDTDDVLSRFRQERRILASLHHPNIARFIDAAVTDDGRPYVVMEYIEGVPLDEYCVRQRLDLRRRLELFQVVCGAVQHAHQNLVVHRDLKPRNILVTEDGAPKLLDFGIGKVIAPTEALSPSQDTRTNVRLLTPQYAAPEQIAGGPVTTATDVHGLGVLLYELLAGSHPFAAPDAAAPDVERAVLETNPRAPSERVASGERRVLQGDLDTIVLKALRKEPERRYQSAAALADDIARHLRGLPVSARSDTIAYRVRKFVRRNAASVAAGVIAISALLATTGVTVIQSRRVTREAELVRLERDKAVEVRSFLMEMFGASGTNSTVGDTVTVRRLLDLQSAGLSTAYADRPELRAEMMEVLADGYDRLGLSAAAEPLAREALGIRRRSLPEGHPDIATSITQVGWIAHELGRSREAALILHEAVAIRRAAGPRHRRDLARSLNDLGVIFNALSHYDSAEAALTEALAIRRAELGERHRAVGITANNLAAAYYYLGKHDDAVRVQRIALDAIQSELGPDHQRSIIALSNLVAFKRTKGDWAAAEPDFRDLLERQTRVQGADHPVTARQMLSLAYALTELAVGRPDDPRLVEAESLFRKAITVFETRLGANHPQVGVGLDGLRGTLNEQNRLSEALAASERAVRITRSSLGDDNHTTAQALGGLALSHWRLGHTADALRYRRESVAGHERTVGPKSPDTGRERSLLCFQLLEQREAAEAADWCARAVESLRGTPGQGGRTEAVYTLWLAHARQILGQSDSARVLLEAVRARIDSGAGGPQARRLLDSLTAVAAAKS